MAKRVVVTGATGNVGKVVASRLLELGLEVRVIGRDAARLRELVERGAQARLGRLEDAAFLGQAFEGATAVFAMVPPNYAAPDNRAHQRHVAEGLAQGLERAGVPRVVSLSSVGADQPAGTGPIAGLHLLEQRLERVPGLRALHLRAAFFMENFLASISLIRSAGINGSAVRADLPLPMIATRDIAARAADLLAGADFGGHGRRELLGPREYTHREATAILGAAVGQPDLPYVELPPEQLRQGLLGAGLSASMADDVVEMQQAFNDGRVRSLEGRSRDNSTPTTLGEFAETVFAPAFRAS